MKKQVVPGELFFEALGAGTPMLCFHGGLGLDHSMFRPWLDPLGAACRLLYFDLRGHGRSTPLDDWSRIAHADLVEDGERIRTLAGAERVIVFGHSYGGFLALEYALRHRDRVRALVLCATSAVMHHAHLAIANAEARATPDQLRILLGLLAEPPETDEVFTESFAAVLPIYFHRYDARNGAALLQGLIARVAPFAHANRRCLPDYDVRNELGSLAVPALVISGRHDWIMPPDHAGVPLAAALPDADHIVFEHSGHYPFVEEPDAFTATVTQWLARRSAEPMP